MPGNAKKREYSFVERDQSNRKRLIISDSGSWGDEMSDLIDRQAAIDYCYALINAENPNDPSDEWNYSQERINQTEVILHHLEFMPSAQPEIIRCKDCKWWDKTEDSPFGYCMAMKHGYMSTNWEIGIYRRYKGDFYCADAERREDG